MCVHVYVRPEREQGALASGVRDAPPGFEERLEGLPAILGLG